MGDQSFLENSYPFERDVRKKCSLVFDRLQKAGFRTRGAAKEGLSRKLATMEKIYFFAYASETNREPFRNFEILKNQWEDLVELGAVGYVDLVSNLEPLYNQWTTLHRKSEYLNAWGKYSESLEETEESMAFLEKHRAKIEGYYRKMETFDEMNQLLVEAGNKALREAGFEEVE